MAKEAFDIALAYKLSKERIKPVKNDFELDEKERVIVVTGPNQGGKSTFARMFGQLHYLACIGCPVPAREASLLLYDHLYSHFEKEELTENLRGKLHDDLLRLHEILHNATSSSVIIMNETFSSATLEDSRFLGRKILEKILAIGAVCVYVTFIYDLSKLSPCIVSMVAVVDSSDPTVRTYKIIRKEADGKAYAIMIAKKYGLTYDEIRRRLNYASILDA
ncbi:MAG: hypothetical protein QXV32_05525 [Conexivisphaerales archaeon]